MRTTFRALLIGLVALAGPGVAGCQPAAGVQLVLKARGTSAVSDQAMEQAREIVARRISAVGLDPSAVARDGSNRLVVTLTDPGAADMVKSLTRRRGRLEFRLVDDSATGGTGSEGPSLASEMLSSSDGRIAVRRGAIVTATMITDAQQGYDQATDQRVVNIAFDDGGRRRFAIATQHNVGKRLAIVVDGTVVSAPVINEPILGSAAQIAGRFTVEEANALAITLRSGTMPVDLTLIAERAAAH